MKALQAAEAHSAGSTTQRIVESVTTAIVERRLLPGTKLAEQQIADIFGVSRTVVRQALNQLSRDRLITLEPARGAFVAQPSVEEARQVFEVRRLLEGVVLDDDPKPVRAAACEAVASHHLQLTLTEGKYHQVKRMLAAVGNRVEALHRSRIGRLALPADLAPGQWRWLGPDDLAAIST